MWVHSVRKEKKVLLDGERSMEHQKLFMSTNSMKTGTLAARYFPHYWNAVRSNPEVQDLLEVVDLGLFIFLAGGHSNINNVTRRLRSHYFAGSAHPDQEL